LKKEWPEPAELSDEEEGISRSNMYKEKQQKKINWQRKKLVVAAVFYLKEAMAMEKQCLSEKIGARIMEMVHIHNELMSRIIGWVLVEKAP
jgi:hypothetical protein